MTNLRDLDDFLRKYYKDDKNLQGKENILQIIKNVRSILGEEISRQAKLIDTMQKNPKAEQKEKNEKKSKVSRLLDEKDQKQEDPDPFAFPESFRDALLDEREKCFKLISELSDKQSYEKDTLKGLIEKIESIPVYFPPREMDVVEDSKRRPRR